MHPGLPSCYKKLTVYEIIQFNRNSKAQFEGAIRRRNSKAQFEGVRHEFTVPPSAERFPLNCRKIEPAPVHRDRLPKKKTAGNPPHRYSILIITGATNHQRPL
jgi:hypothetical protein